MRLYKYLRNIYYNYEKLKKEKYLNNLVSNGLKLGKKVDIVADYFFDPSHCYLISIGDNTTIAPNVRLIAHDASSKKLVGFSKIGKIDIGENCFIGDSVIVLPNVTIGSNSVVGSGSVVTKDIPPNSIAAGNPAKVIANTEDYANKLNQLRAGKKLFDTEYYIDRLDERKRGEILNEVKDSMGFMV